MLNGETVPWSQARDRRFLKFMYNMLDTAI